MPYQLVRQVVAVRSTPAVIEIFHKGMRVASHVRLHKPYAAATNLGARTAEVVAKIMESYPHPEMGYRSCLGIIRL